MTSVRCNKTTRDTINIVIKDTLDNRARLNYIIEHYLEVNSAEYETTESALAILKLATDTLFRTLTLLNGENKD